MLTSRRRTSGLDLHENAEGRLRRVLHDGRRDSRVSLLCWQTVCFSACLYSSESTGPVLLFLCLPFANPGLRHAKREEEEKRREEKKRTTTTTKTFVFLDATRLLFLIALARARLSLLLSAGLSLDEKSTKTFGIDRASALRPTPRAVVAVVLAQKGRKTYVRRSMAQRRGSDLPLSPRTASATNPSSRC